mmetsp:Transcript_3721/g.10587  ORF Transcript_3721/g.10587 Transcript_3721/m.10587 type:complete len:202 (+) Transcript_3721:776-1381(+)
MPASAGFSGISTGTPLTSEGKKPFGVLIHPGDVLVPRTTLPHAAYMPPMVSCKSRLFRYPKPGLFAARTLLSKRNSSCGPRSDCASSCRSSRRRRSAQSAPCTRDAASTARRPWCAATAAPAVLAKEASKRTIRVAGRTRNGARVPLRGIAGPRSFVVARGAGPCPRAASAKRTRTHARTGSAANHRAPRFGASAMARCPS